MRSNCTKPKDYFEGRRYQLESDNRLCLCGHTRIYHIEEDGKWVCYGENPECSCIRFKETDSTNMEEWLMEDTAKTLRKKK